MGKLSRQRGHDFEREVAKEFRSLFPEARRHLEYHPLDANGIDLVGVGPFSIQCKRGRKYHSINAIEEVENVPGKIPALVTRGDSSKSVIALYLSDFLGILQELERLKLIASCDERGI